MTDARPQDPAAPASRFPAATPSRLPDSTPSRFPGAPASRLPAAPPSGLPAAHAVPPGELPGVRARVRAVAADLAAGRNCLWLVTDALVDSGLAEELYGEALRSGPAHVDVPAPGPEAPSPRARAADAEPVPRPADPAPRPADDPPWDDPDDRPWDDTDDLPFLDLPDDGFDLDLGWSVQDRPPRLPAPRRASDVPRHDPYGLLARLAKELSAEPDGAVAALVAPGRDRRPVVGVRAWTERDGGPDPDTGGDTRTGAGAEARTGARTDTGWGARTDTEVGGGARTGTDTGADPRAGAGAGAGVTRPRGAAVERLFRSLAAAVKEAGLPPGERPRLLVVARLRDLPETLPDELRHGLGDTAVHWWWGALGRHDTAAAIAPVLDRGPAPGGRDRDAPGERIRRAVRAETVVEICGPDLELARLLAAEWDGTQHTLGAVLGRCLATLPGPAPADCPPLRRIGAHARPGAELRRAWARGAVVSWEGLLRPHPAVWHPAAADARARLATHLSQAQQRVLSPWIEEARQRLAVRALGHLNRPAAAVVADHADRPAAHPGGGPERAFLELQVGELLRAHISGALALPPDDARLLRLLVRARNVLAHRSVLDDRTLDDLCAELAGADLRA
ncbi:hypothetical protein [Streptomyces sp. NPDC047141]|uniref:hypothetical protein n=1 Tax=Streptomyces sp. NPDC047141 TaxID=3155738 RepID=UPI0033E75DCA